MNRLFTGIAGSVLTLAALAVPAPPAQAHHDGDRRDRETRHHDRDRDGRRDHRHHGEWAYYAPYRSYYYPPYCYAPFPGYCYPGYGVSYQGPYFGIWLGH
jgi:hypothetical protein